MRVADFFCGGGGFSEGFRQAGFEIVFAVDKWELAVKTYRGNKRFLHIETQPHNHTLTMPPKSIIRRMQ